MFPPKGFQSKHADEHHFSLSHLNFFGVIQTQNVLLHIHECDDKFSSEIVLTFVNVQLDETSDTGHFHRCVSASKIDKHICMRFFQAM